MFFHVRRREPSVRRSAVGGVAAGVVEQHLGGGRRDASRPLLQQNHHRRRQRRLRILEGLLQEPLRRVGGLQAREGSQPPLLPPRHRGRPASHPRRLLLQPGKLYSISENHIPLCIDKDSLHTCGNWDINRVWNRPFTSHPKRDPGTGELVIIGADAVKPYIVLGIISADGTKLTHKVDIKLNRSVLCHEIGVTERYNVIIDMPLTINFNRLIGGGPLIKFEKENYARIGIMPRYGDADTIRWFKVETNCTFHIINCYEDKNEVIVRGCRSLDSIIPGPEFGYDKFEWFSRGFRQKTNKEDIVNRLTDEGYLCYRPYEWRLNMETGEVRERYLAGPDISMDFPIINDSVSGVYNKYAYTQVIDPVASSLCGLPKYGGLAKLCFEEQVSGISVMDTCPADFVRVQHHAFGKNQFCSGAAFVSKPGGTEEDDGWIISFVHDEETNISQVHIFDAKRFECNPVSVLMLPCRVPYGFHGYFISS